MGFLDHLDELRKRIIRSCVAIGAGMVDRVGVRRSHRRFRPRPDAANPAGRHEPHLHQARRGVFFYLDLAFIGGFVLSAPFVTYQVWRFIAPGLYAKEKRLAVPFVLLATVGTLGGALFSHYVLFPAMMGFFQTFDSPRVKLMPRVEDTFELYKNTLIAMVAVFQIPTLAFFLAKMRMVTARFLWRNFHYAILLIFIAAAALTPSTDPWNQIVFAAPMIAMYVISIGIVWLVGPKRGGEETTRAGSGHLRLVFAATVIDQARRHRDRSRDGFGRKR